MWKQLVRALRLCPSLFRLWHAVRLWRAAAGKPGSKPPAPIKRRSSEHVWTSYASWPAGEMIARKLAVPECVLCSAKLTRSNREEVCPWFNEPSS